MTVGSDGGLKEGKKRTNGLNAPTLIILGGKMPGTDRSARLLGLCFHDKPTSLTIRVRVFRPVLIEVIR